MSKVFVVYEKNVQSSPPCKRKCTQIGYGHPRSRTKVTKIFERLVKLDMRQKDMDRLGEAFNIPVTAVLACVETLRQSAKERKAMSGQQPDPEGQAAISAGKTLRRQCREITNRAGTLRAVNTAQPWFWFVCFHMHENLRMGLEGASNCYAVVVNE